MKITYILPNRTCEIKGESLYSPLASERYRIINPSEELHKLGHEINMNFEPVRGSKTDVVFMGKFLTSPKSWLDTIAEYKDMGAKIVWDICDNYLDQYTKSAEFSALIKMTDRFTVPSVTMLKLMDDMFNVRPDDKTCNYIPDAPELDWSSHYEMPTKHCLWFGNTKNLECFFKADFQPSTTIQFITSQNAAKLIDQLQIKANVCFTPWSLENVRRALNASTVTLIPAKLDDPWYLTKSANRALESLWCGVPVLASRIPEYELVGLPGIYFMDDTNFMDGMERMLDSISNVKKSQEIIAEKYLITKTVKLWEAAFA